MKRTSLVGLTVIALTAGISVAGTPAGAASAPAITTASTGPAGPLTLNDEQMDSVTAGVAPLVVLAAPAVGKAAAAAAGFLAGYVATRVIDRAIPPDGPLLDGPNVRGAAGQCGCPQ